MEHAENSAERHPNTTGMVDKPQYELLGELSPETSPWERDFSDFGKMLGAREKLETHQRMWCGASEAKQTELTKLHMDAHK